MELLVPPVADRAGTDLLFTRRLGHASTRTTEDTYGHLIPRRSKTVPTPSNAPPNASSDHSKPGPGTNLTATGH